MRVLIHVGALSDDAPAFAAGVWSALQCCCITKPSADMYRHVRSVLAATSSQDDGDIGAAVLRSASLQALAHSMIYASDKGDDAVPSYDATLAWVKVWCRRVTHVLPTVLEAFATYCRALRECVAPPAARCRMLGRGRY